MILEIVWVMEKGYRLSRKGIREPVESILKTPGLECLPEPLFRQALIPYKTQNIKFADAVVAYRSIKEGLCQGGSTCNSV
jgi:predicted nucleic-acid-binding protein